jgi:hypothetical protein
LLRHGCLVLFLCYFPLYVKDIRNTKTGTILRTDQRGMRFMGIASQKPQVTYNKYKDKTYEKKAKMKKIQKDQKMEVLVFSAGFRVQISDFRIQKGQSSAQRKPRWRGKLFNH